jgi:FkbM family methyltransferase
MLISLFFFFIVLSLSDSENAEIGGDSSVSITPPPVLHYFSQDFQDFFLHSRIFHNFQNGTFLDIGAHNGVYYSNSLFFENFLHWKGICVEPNPEVFQELLINRPEAINLNYAITDIDNDPSSNTTTTSATADFYLGQGFANMISGLKKHYHPSHLERLESEHAHSGNISTTIIQVPIKRLADIIQEHHLTRIHYLSIDVEGAEFSVLKSIGWKDDEKNSTSSSSLFIDVITYENHNSYSEEIRDQIRSYLSERGYMYLTNLPNTQDSIVIHRNSPFFKESLLLSTSFQSQSQAIQEEKASGAGSSHPPPVEAIGTILNAFFLKDFQNGIFITYDGFSPSSSVDIDMKINHHNNAILSNCLFLEDIFHWKGINIIRNPFIFQQLQIQRPNSQILNYVIDEMVNGRDESDLQGKTSQGEEREHQVFTRKEASQEENPPQEQQLFTAIVKIKRFDEIFEEYNLSSHIHYLSLNSYRVTQDGKGKGALTDLSILRSINWEATFIDIITFQKIGYSNEEIDEILSFLFDQQYYAISNIPTVQHKILIHSNSPFLKHIRYHPQD